MIWRSDTLQEPFLRFKCLALSESASESTDNEGGDQPFPLVTRFDGDDSSSLDDRSSDDGDQADDAEQAGCKDKGDDAHSSRTANDKASEVLVSGESWELINEASLSE